MLKIIIADDERSIRETISQLIDWNSLDLELVAQCKNGIEAYNAILDESPDIVMTDIKMPGLSGIELVEKCVCAHLDTQFIILSGYGEFDYARSAMKYGVRHYLLKPCNEQQIIASLKEVIRDCYRRSATRQLEKQHALLQDTLCQNVIFTILSEGVDCKPSERLALYAPYRMYLDFDQTAYRMLLVCGLPQADLSETYQALTHWHTANAPGLPLYGLYVRDMLVLFFQQYDTDAHDLGPLRRTLSGIVHNGSFSVQEAGFPNLGTLLDDLLGQLAYYGSFQYLSGSRFVVACNYRNAIHATKELCGRLCGGSHGEPALRRICLDELKERLDGISDLDFLIQLSSSILLYLSSHSSFCTSVEATELILALHDCATVEEIRRFLLPRLTQMVCQGPAETGSSQDFIPRLQQYVRENLSNSNLTLRWIAENYLYMNVDYVSRKFVRVTGQKFSSYLTDTRIRLAKQLLAEYGTEKIHEVAEQVGCGNNPQYFSQIFKKNTGMTPTAYARKVRGGEPCPNQP